MNYDKLSAGMSALIEEFSSQGAAMLTESLRAVPLASFDAAGTPEVQSFIRCDFDAAIPEIEGVTMHAKRGSARTARISLSGVDRLSERDDVHRISPALTLKPLNDVCAQRTRLPFYKGSHPELGRNVVVGIVDSGIDAGHPVFANRIHSIWDQTISGVGWGSTNYGTVLTGPSLNVSADTNGHGTHVAGIAAGNDAVFGGVAPEAQIVCVKTNFLDAGIGDGIRYIFAVAEQLGVPAVVNLSLGGHHDAHDGSDSLSELIDERSGPGRIVVSAAGNEGGDDIHAAAIVPGGQTAEILFKVPPSTAPGSTPWVRLNGWYGAGNCEISIQTSSGDVTPFQPVITGPNRSRTYSFSNAILRITTPPPAININNDHSILVEIAPGPFANRVQGGTWRLRVRNVENSDIRIDVWSIVPVGARDAAFLSPFNSSEMKIGSPGTARRAITVASFTSRNTWTDSSGISRAVGLTLDTISDFSSPGPLRNGLQKPDVTAPGAMIVSCLSRSSSPPSTNVINGGFRVNAGTSMACPYITGLVALLLDRDPTLDAAAIKALLKSNSAVPTLSSGTFHPSWGFGFIDSGSL
jgi:subtilisin family serine protease